MTKEELKDRLLSFGKTKAAVILGVVGILLIFLSSFFQSGSVKKSENHESSKTAEEYKTEVQNEILEIVREISGDENAKVIVTLDTGKKYSYADELTESVAEKSSGEDKDVSKETKNNYTTVKAEDGAEKPLITAEYMPEIRGVAVVANTGNNKAAKEEMKSAISAALCIASKRIYIAESGRNSY